MTEKQTKLIDGLGHGLSRAAASKAAGYKSSGAAASALANPHLRRQIARVMDDCGLDEGALLVPIKDALTADRYIGFDARAVADHKTRLAAAELGFKLRGDLAPDAQPPAQPPRPLVIMIRTSDPGLTPRAVVLDAITS